MPVREGPPEPETREDRRSGRPIQWDPRLKTVQELRRWIMMEHDRERQTCVVQAGSTAEWSLRTEAPRNQPMCHSDQGSRICLQGVSAGRGYRAQHFLERGGGRVSRGRIVSCLICLGSLLLAPEVACAQDEVRNYRMPILRVETGGHHARVRSILWEDEETLLTAGEDKLVNVWDLKAEPRLARSLRPPICAGWRGRFTRSPLPSPTLRASRTWRWRDTALRTAAAT